MQNYIQPGEHVTVTAAANLTSGSLVKIGGLVGVAQGDAASGEEVVLVRRGVFTLPKVSAQAWTVGQKLYHDTATGAVTSTATSNTLIGVALAAAENPSATGVVLLDGAAR
ncbi:putative RecA/RadA family phage recombinase [Rhodobacter aestuarii]|uniref:Predicted phage recombinase, RecA/RadA family n=1 Tax=Rhodobacter aestuarii TaxID=453582 RepID=A0A1N7M8H2_9RHOB|nr:MULTISPECIES: DUF2190 family protein [Rhodobacter]PTV94919.1 putative RecA/RadA family phage recombinase [Rhodobacter aestuarii]SIS82405.1 Predicted phage recombinase, RecA/RadA family [Rhodobacter aestuarii]SOC13764.1 predicted RecA/RadA family phage recombinase [Rhodobacter sp. JA431]